MNGSGGFSKVWKPTTARFPNLGNRDQCRGLGAGFQGLSGRLDPPRDEHAIAGALVGEDETDAGARAPGQGIGKIFQDHVGVAVGHGLHLAVGLGFGDGTDGVYEGAAGLEVANGLIEEGVLFVDALVQILA